MSNEKAIATTVEIVCAYIANNSLPVAELPALLRNVYVAVDGLDQPATVVETAPEVEKPTAAQVRKSITPDALISFIDGKAYKTLKRHLGSHGLDPRGYRERYGLPDDYPMVAPSYAAQRSALAKSIGLGQGPATRKKAA